MVENSLLALPFIPAICARGRSGVLVELIHVLDAGDRALSSGLISSWS